MRRILQQMLDSEEFFGVWHPVASAHHRRNVHLLGEQPGTGTTNRRSHNWHVWQFQLARTHLVAVNYLLIESLQRFHHYYGDEFQVEFPTGSGNLVTLGNCHAAPATPFAAVCA
jgi:hypothetical protein